jgi:hypothetical protein
MIELLAKSLINEHFDTSRNKYVKENENENEYENEESSEYYYFYNNKEFIIFIIFLGISFWAAYLSWSCNTKANYPLSVKIACAINAYTFGIFYILYYFIAVYGTCNKGYYVNVQNTELIDLIKKVLTK